MQTTTTTLGGTQERFVSRALRQFANLSVARKLQLIMAMSLFGLAMVFVLSLRSAGAIGAELSVVGRQQLPAVRNMTLVDMMHDGIRAGVFGSLLASHKSDAEGMAAAETEIGELCANLREYAANIEKLELTPSTRKAIDESKPAIEDYVTGALLIGANVRAGKTEDLESAMAKFGEQFEALEGCLEQLGELIEKDADVAVARGEEAATSAMWQMIVTLLCVVSIAIAFSMFVGRSISQPLGAAVEVLESGDLSKLADVQSEDEIGRMARAVTATVNSIERQKGEMARVVSMMENAPINMLYADQDGRVQYQNPASKQSVTRVAGGLGLTPDAVVGAPIQSFLRGCKQPPTGLNDGTGLPFRATTEIGKEIVDLLVTALRDHQGTYLGPMLTWEIKTEQVQLQRQNEAMADDRRRQAEAEQRRTAEQAERDRVASERERQRIADEAERDRHAAEELQRKIDVLLAAVDEAAKGDLRQKVSVEGNDAVSKVGGALDTLFTDLRASIAEIARNADQLAHSSSGLRQSSTSMHTAAETTSMELHAVSAASEQVSRSVQGVSLATEEMSQRIREIASNASEATRVAASAVEAAGATESTMARLSESSQKIGEVVKLIHTIAQQTNLLALNATIEAARAGEAGRGFAVVANEVKELANATSKATGEISQRIDAIQGDTKQARTAISRIGEIVHQISDLQTSIAASVEEQTATTKEIARTLSEAAQGTNEIVGTIARASQCAGETSLGAQSSLQSAESLSTMADDLNKLVGAFRY
ncbi:MAG: methyl-accepting chemotaxis protein [Planctomycetota bacterium]